MPQKERVQCRLVQVSAAGNDLVDGKCALADQRFCQGESAVQDVVLYGHSREVFEFSEQGTRVVAEVECDALYGELESNLQ